MMSKLFTPDHGTGRARVLAGLFYPLFFASFLMFTSCGPGEHAGATPTDAEIRLIPVRIGDLYQYIDGSGQVVIPAKFTQATIFREGLAAVAVPGGSFGFINEMGEFVVEPKYGSVTGFSEGMAWVRYRGGEPIAINASGAELFTLENCAIARIFHGGRALCDFHGKGSAYVDKAGVVNFLITDGAVGYYSEGLVLTKDGTTGKFGYMDTTGTVVIAPRFDQASPFNDGRAKVITSGKQGVIDRAGSWVFPALFDEVERDGDLYIFSENGKRGWCDDHGNVVIEPRFTEVLPFGSSALAPFTNGSLHTGPYGYIDRKGRVIIDPMFKRALPFSGGSAIVVVGNETDPSSFTGKVGLIDMTGAFIAEPVYDELAEDAWFAMMAANSSCVSANYSAVRSDFFDAQTLASAIDFNRPQGLLGGMTVDEARSLLDSLMGSGNVNPSNRACLSYHAGGLWIRSQVNCWFVVFANAGRPATALSQDQVSTEFNGNAYVDSVGFRMGMLVGSMGKKNELIQALEVRLTGSHTRQGSVWTNEWSTVRLKNGLDPEIVIILHEAPPTEPSEGSE